MAFMRRLGRNAGLALTTQGAGEAVSLASDTPTVCK